jgi:hypothetical protein
MILPETKRQHHLNLTSLESSSKVLNRSIDRLTATFPELNRLSAESDSEPTDNSERSIRLRPQIGDNTDVKCLKHLAQ